MKSSAHLENDIPADRRRAETALVRALLAPKPKRIAVVKNAVLSFNRSKHSDLICIGLAGIIRAIESPFKKRSFAHQLERWCWSQTRPECRACPVCSVRLRRRC